MTKLTGIQLLILSQASKRADRCVDISSIAKGSAAQKALRDLLTDGLLEELRAKDALPAWRKGNDNLPRALRITNRGLKALRVEGNVLQEPPNGNRNVQSVTGKGKASAPAGKTRVTAKSPASAKLQTAAARRSASARSPSKTAPLKRKPTKTFSATTSKKSKSNLTGRQAVTKQDAVLTMLRRPKGATIADLMKATDWQQHSVRGFFAGTVRKRMGLNLVSDKSSGQRCYRITGSRPSRKA